MGKITYEFDWLFHFLRFKFVFCFIENTSDCCKIYDALKLKIGRMIVSMVTVSPMLAMISSAGL